MKRNHKFWRVAWLSFALAIFLFGPVIALAGPAAVGAIVAASTAQRAANERAASSARASACYNISDADARAACLARAHRDPGRCYGVQRSDLRAQCLAEVRQ